LGHLNNNAKINRTIQNSYQELFLLIATAVVDEPVNDQFDVG